MYYATLTVPDDCIADMRVALLSRIEWLKQHAYAFTSAEGYVEGQIAKCNRAYYAIVNAEILVKETK